MCTQIFSEALMMNEDLLHNHMNEKKTNHKV